MKKEKEKIDMNSNYHRKEKDCSCYECYVKELKREQKCLTSTEEKKK